MIIKKPNFGYEKEGKESLLLSSYYAYGKKKEILLADRQTIIHISL
jgi:hypothetical protein